jgi:hypothetical protein
MPARLAYLAVGREELLTQAKYALYSALAWRGDAACELQIHTDRAGAFANLASEAGIHDVTPERVRAWCRPYGFAFRMKPKLVEDLLVRHAGERIVLVDADTLFTGPISSVLDRVGPRRAAMHAREYQPLLRQDRVGSQHENFRRRMKRARYRGAPISLEPWMWNSGLVGLDASHLPLVREWIRFIDEVFPTNPKPFVEQYGLAWLLQRHGHEISETRDVLVHYYDDKARHLARIREELPVLERMPLADALERVRSAPIRMSSPPPPRRPIPPYVRLWTSLRTRVRVYAALATGARRMLEP